MDTKEERYQQLKQALANTPVAAAEQTNACQPKQYQSANGVQAWSPGLSRTQAWSFDDIQALPAITTLDLSALTSADIQAWSMSNTAPFANSSVTLSGSGGSGAVYSITAGGGGGSGIAQAGNWAKPYTTTNSGDINIDANDIKLRGKSLMESLDRIEQRLGILDCDEQLEQHWDKLKALGDEYRELKQHIEDKMKTFETLKTMPKPEIK
jgi:hypothetical protein